MDMEKIRQLQEIIDGSDNIVFFGGAGVSTESGIPDFRSVDGLYHQKCATNRKDKNTPRYLVSLMNDEGATMQNEYRAKPVQETPEE